MYSFYNAETQECVEPSCPDSSAIYSENGDCKVCPPYSYPDSLNIYCIETTKCPAGQYIKEDGHCSDCKDFKGLHPFDDQQQVHCEMIDQAIEFKAEYSIPICMSGWMAEAESIGCVPCKEYERFSYKEDYCIVEECEPQSILLQNGFCKPCPPH